MKRENSIDIVRGIVMIIMALDHVRDLMHIDSITQNPTNFNSCAFYDKKQIISLKFMMQIYKY